MTNFPVLLEMTAHKTEVQICKSEAEAHGMDEEDVAGRRQVGAGGRALQREHQSEGSIRAGLLVETPKETIR